MLEGLRDLFVILGKRGRRRFVLLCVAMAIQGFLEAASVALVLPFLQLALDPASTEGSVGAGIASWLGFSEGTQPVVVVGWLAVIVFVAANGMSALTNWLMFQAGAMENHRLSLSLQRGYMQQPYRFFLARNTGTLTKNVVYEADVVMRTVYVPLVSMVGRSLMVGCMVGFLLYAQPVVALIALAAVSALYGGLYLVIRDRVGEIGVRRVTSNSDRFRTSQEGLSGIKEIRVLGRQNYFINAFGAASHAFAKVSAQSQMIGTVPRYFLETVGIGGALVYLTLFLQGETSALGIVPLVAVYAAAAYRLMPALQQIYASIMSLRYNQATIRLLRDELTVVAPEDPTSTKQASTQGVDSVIGFEHSVELRAVRFTYDGADSPVLDRVSMAIRKNTCVGIVGETGAGKTTVVDVLLGLLQPQSGGLVLDGEPIRPDQIRSWQNIVGYVPQLIYLADSSIRANIAFGVEDDEIDDDRIARAAELAGVHRFIMDDTPDGYHTVVGERGVRLSGGQRQRIGIARALYRNPEVLVLDEATSSLDNRTDNVVMNAIRALSGHKTVIVVAHRLSTIRECQQVFVIERGRVREEGTYDELLNKGGVFTQLVRTGDYALQSRQD